MAIEREFKFTVEAGWELPPLGDALTPDPPLLVEQPPTHPSGDVEPGDAGDTGETGEAAGDAAREESPT